MYTFKLLLSTIGIIGAVLAPSPARCSSPPIKEGQFYLTTADGVTIFVRHKYTTRAHKVPVLLVHGTWGNSQTWDFPGRSVMDYLAVRGYDTYALDMRGMGMSARPASYFTIGLPQRVGDVAAVATYILSTTGRQPVVIGHSQGAWVTTLLAASHPELVAGVGLSGMPGNGLYTTPDLIALLQAVIASGTDRVALPPEIAYLLAFGHDPVTGSPTVNAETFQTFYGMLEADSILAIAQQGLPGFFESVMAPAVSAVHVRALVVDGAYDFQVGEARATALYNALGSQQKQLLIFPRNTHFWFLEDNFHATMRAFDEFLSGF